MVRIVSAFECGAIVNPDNLRGQIEGAKHQGLGVRTALTLPELAVDVDFNEGREVAQFLRKFPPIPKPRPGARSRFFQQNFSAAALNTARNLSFSSF